MSNESDPAAIRDHPFVPRDRDEPWGVCRDCALAEAAHVEALLPYRPTGIRPAPR